MNTINIKKYKTFEEINEFCLNNKYCLNHKKQIIKQILKILTNKSNLIGGGRLSELEQIRTENILMDFCSNHKEYCVKNKKLICKQLLIINKYKTNESFDDCKIYNELLKLARELGIRKSTYDLTGNIIVKMSYTLRVHCNLKASVDLRRFLIFNNYKIEPVPPVSPVSPLLLDNIVDDIVDDNAPTILLK